VFYGCGKLTTDVCDGRLQTDVNVTDTCSIVGSEVAIVIPTGQTPRGLGPTGTLW